MKKTPTDLKLSNRISVYNLIRKYKEVSRVDLSEKTGLSGPTVLKIMKYFSDYNIVSDVGTIDTKMGRKPSIFKYEENFAKVLSILVEGKYIKAGIVNCSGKVISIITEEVSIKSVEELFELIKKYIDEIYTEDMLGIGIGMAATVDSNNNTLKFAPLMGIFEDTDITTYIEQIEKEYNTKVFIENDVKALAIAEHRGHKLYNDYDLCAISIGTGVGSGLVIDSKLLKGKRSFAGEIGYMNFDTQDFSKQETVHEKGWLERNIGLEALTEKFSLDLKDKNTITLEMKEHIAKYISVVITNISLITDINIFSIGGVVSEVLDDDFLDILKIYIEKKNILNVKVQFAKFSELSGLAEIVFENSLEEILLKDEI